MSDYIEREAALAVCQKEYEERLSMADWCGDTVAWNIGGAIKSIPAADVALVRHGRWIDSNKRPVPWDEQNPTCPLYSAYCSECGEWLAGSGECAAIGLYCPNCGARMDKEDKHEAD